MTIRCAVVDDHTLVRAGIVSLLGDLPGVEVVAEGASGRDAIRIVGAMAPDVLLLDLNMPDISGLEALDRIRGDGAATQVVILSMHKSLEHVRSALRLGAAGYLLKDAAPAELGAALATVTAGGRWLSHGIDLPDGETVCRAADERALLTERQREVLRLIADGLGTREIAERLRLSVKTVETHRAQIMERLAIRDVAGLVKYAIRQGLSGL